MYQKVRLVMVVIFMISALLVGKTVSSYVSSDKVAERNGTYVVILDPGHGGNDPGKIGVNKKKEKDINLQMAKKVKEKLEKENITVKMTRTKDEGLYSKTARNHKIEDMKERVRIINEEKPNAAVSIHQNSYTAENVKGAQVFYFTHSKEGKEAAERMQESLRMFDTENKREAKANNTYYMLKKTNCPTIIVECGFLSNREEAEKLADEGYQEKMATVICNGIVNILEDR